MTNKEKIIAEIEWLKKELYKQQDFRNSGSPIPVYDTNAIDGMLKVLDEVKGFINSIPNEQPIKISEYLSARAKISDYLYNLIFDQAHRGAPMLQYGDTRINEEVDLILKMAIRELNKKVLTEQPSEELEEKIEEKISEYWNEWFSHGDYFEGTLPKNVFAAYCHKIANWQKEQTINKACEWLNKNVVEYHPRKGELRPIVNSNAFREAMEKEDEQ